MTTKPSSSLIITRSPIVSKEGTATRDLNKWFQDIDKKVNTSLTQLGLDPNAVVGGNNSTIGQQLQHIDAAGQLQPPGVGFEISDVPGTITGPQVGFNLDQVPNGSSHFSVAQIDAARLAIINFADTAHKNKTLDSIDDGTTYQRFTRVAFGQVELPTSSILSASSATVTVPATGVLNTDVIIWTFVGAPTSDYEAGSLIVLAYVTPDNINFLVRNTTLLPITPGSQYINYEAIR